MLLGLLITRSAAICQSRYEGQAEYGFGKSWTHTCLEPFGGELDARIAIPEPRRHFTTQDGDMVVLHRDRFRRAINKVE
jgi:hypothetical protein